MTETSAEAASQQTAADQAAATEVTNGSTATAPARRPNRQGEARLVR